MKSWRLSVICVSIVTLLAIHVNARAQTPSAQAGLATAISETRAGEFRRALITLSDVIVQLSGVPDESSTLARVHAYRVVAFIGLDQTDRARASALLALGADPNIVVDATEFGPNVVALFRDARRPFSENPEAAGRAAEQAGRPQEAFLAYLLAFQALPEPPSLTDDQRLREKIIGAVLKLDTKPVIPPEARAHLRKADDLLAADAILGGGGAAGAQQAAAVELRRAVRSAPWWPDASFRLATVLQKLQRVDEALLNLNLYRLADPDGYTATVNRANPARPPESALPRPPPERAPIVAAILNIYWPKSARAFGAGSQKVFCDDQRVADLEKDRFIVLKAVPGTHTVKFRDKTVSALFEGGKEYYLRVQIEGYPAHLAIHVANPVESAAEIRDKQISANDTKNTYSAECTAPGAILKRKGH